jgi:hypothetical protein
MQGFPLAGTKIRLSWGKPQGELMPRTCSCYGGLMDGFGGNSFRQEEKRHYGRTDIRGMSFRSADGDCSTLTPMIIHQSPLTPLQAAQAMQAAQLNLALQNLGGLNAANLPLLQQLSVVAPVCSIAR